MIISKKTRPVLWIIIVILLTFTGAYIFLSHLEQSYRIQSYHEIEPGLFLGERVKEPPPSTQAVVNLCGSKDPYSVEEMLWEPILEGKHTRKPDLDFLKEVVAFIEDQHNAGRVVYVHCLAGVNRSAMAVTAYLMKKHGWSREEALAFVRSKRPIIRPCSSLMKLLAEWEEHLNQ